MKATTWLCPVLTLLCATKLVYTSQRGSYGDFPYDDMDSPMLQNDNFRTKRNKPSLSIVNPLDVLRQRLLLEIARRQMKENSRQVELNRAILKNVGKRMANKYSSSSTAALYNKNELQQRQQQKMQQKLLQHLPSTYEYELPATLIFDYLQKQPQHQSLPYEWTALQFDKNYINDAINEYTDGQRDDDEDKMQDKIILINGVLGSGGNDGKYSLKHIKQTNNEHPTLVNGQQHETATFQKSINNRNDDTRHLISHHYNNNNSNNNNDNNNNNNNNNNSNNNNNNNNNKENLNLDFNDVNPLSLYTNPNDNKNEMDINDGDYQIQHYLYNLHKNHLTRK